MDKNQGIEKFLSGNFGEAIIIGRVTKGKIVLTLKLKGKPDEYIDFSGEELKNEFRIEDIESFNSLLSNYLNKVSLYYLYYHADKIGDKEMYCFDLSGDRDLKLQFDKEFYSMLPVDFASSINKKTRNDILELIDELEVQNIVIDNLDCFNKNFLLIKYIPDEILTYNALSIEDDNGKRKVSDDERDFIYKLLEKFIKSNEIDIDYFYNIKVIIETELDNINIEQKNNILKNISLKLGKTYFDGLEINLNDKTILTIKNIETIIIFKEFLDSYLNNYENEITKKER